MTEVPVAGAFRRRLVGTMAVGVTALRESPLRTLLSTLGVVIGVASLVAILALGDGLERYSRAQIETTTDLQLISVTPRMVESVDGLQVRRTDVVMLGPARADTLAAALAGRADLALTITGSGWFHTADDTTRRATLVTAAMPGTAQVFGQTLTAGRFLEHGDTLSRPTPAMATAGTVRVLGVTPPDLIGRTIMLDQRAFIIVGVIDGRAADAARLIVPIDSSAIDWLGDRGRTAPTAAIKARRAEEIDAVRGEVERWLARYGQVDREFTVQSQQSRAAQLRQGILVFKLVMGSITGISIVVGGIGIMNVLLASVVERTREIGIRRAVGARAGEVRLQFLTESVAIAGTGALIGVALGLSGAFGISAAIRAMTDARIAAGFTWSTVLVAGICALLVGVLFGTYPARRAARLSPIEAIRHE